MAYTRSSGPRRWLGRGGALAVFGGVSALVVALGPGITQAVEVQPPPLSAVPVPGPGPNGGDIVDQPSAVQLGKALFWDQQVGGDGKVACATCHFHAGADNRTVATINAGPDGKLGTADDIVGSQGVMALTFRAIGHPIDDCFTPIGQQPATSRSVTGRNAPSVINAVFNRDNFWDGRANHDFNRTDPFGGTARAGSANGPLVGTGLIAQSSLASQAVGPPDNKTEMSCDGRQFNATTANAAAGSLASKMLSSKPLAGQVVSTADSVLFNLADTAVDANNNPVGGLTTSYQSLIDAAFGADSPTARNSASQFTSIFGQAVQAYESTLISSQTPFDRFVAGDTTALTLNQQAGLSTFQGRGQCKQCHSGSELTDASWSQFNLDPALGGGPLNGDGGDQGFHNIGVRPTGEDLGRQPFSVSGSTKDRGAFKTPGLRNVALTAPYFHNGGKKTLADVVAFYSNGGDFANPEKAKRIQKLSLPASVQANLVDFLQTGLTDTRVKCEQAPFDHPALTPPNGAALPETGASGAAGCS